MADEVVSSLETAWRNPKHREQWRMTLTRYCEPIRSIPVDLVTTEHVLDILKPIWGKVPETASRLRGRIEKVLDAARAKGHRTGENPARWRGHLDHLLPARQKLTRGHHKALPYPEVPALTARLQRSGSVSALCLEFTILTAARSGEAMGARWGEIGLDRGIWTVPKERMKAGREHRVPLSSRAREILVQMGEIRDGELVFPGQRRGRPLSTMALEMVMRRMRVDATVHGFRSAFRDWAAEMTSAPREVAEAALAHTLENKVEAAYRRTDLFEKRRALMEQWAQYCSSLPPADEVIP
jgi:integrase